MAVLSDFYPYVLPMVNGCSVILADQYIRDTCIDFCSKSLFVQNAMDPIDAISGIADYDFDVPTDQVVAMVVKAWFLRRKLEVIAIGNPKTRPEIYNTQFDGASVNGGYPTSLIQKDGVTFTIDAAPAENSSAAITMVVATKPSRNASTIADSLFNEYAYEIGMGAAGRLMRLPKNPFTDMNAAMAYEHVYVEARNAAQLRANMSLGGGDSQVNIRRMA